MSVKKIRATVTQFFERKLYGFARAEDGEIYWIHQDRLCRCEPVVNSIVLVNMEVPKNGRRPKAGDAIVLTPGETANGKKADRWCFAADFDEAGQRLKVAQAKRLQLPLPLLAG